MSRPLFVGLQAFRRPFENVYPPSFPMRFSLNGCPYCGSDEMRPSRARKLLGKWLTVLLPILIVRCKACMRRHYRFGRAKCQDTMHG